MKHSPFQRRLRVAGCLAIPVLACSAASAADWTVYPGFFSPGSKGMFFHDLGLDGQRELIVTGAVYSDGPIELVAAVRETALGVRVAHVAQLLSGEAIDGEVVADPRPGTARIFASTLRNGASWLVALEGPQLQRTTEIPLSGNFRLSAIADVDADGQLEAVGVEGVSPPSEYGRPQVRDLASGTIKWTDVELHSAVAVYPAALDTDAALELVDVHDVPRPIVSQMFDGATHAQEWAWSPGFSRRFVVGDFDGNPTTSELATSRYTESQAETVVFSSLWPWNSLSTRRPQALAAYDWESGGADELIMAPGEPWNRAVTVYRPDSWSVVWRRPLSVYLELHALAVGDLNADAQPEVAIASGHGDSHIDKLEIVDSQTQPPKFAMQDEEGPHSSVVRGDFDGDGAMEIAFATIDSASTYGGARIVVLDAETGRELRRSPTDLFFRRNLEGLDLRAAQMDGDAALELVVGGMGLSDGLVRVIDGATLSVQWQQTFALEGPTTIALMPTTGSAAPDVIAATAHRVHRLAGATGTIVWSSDQLGTGPPGRRPIAIGQVDGDTPREALVDVMGALKIIDTDTGNIERSFEIGAGALDLTVEGAADACRIVEYRPAELLRRRCDSLATASTRALIVSDASLVLPLTDSYGDLVVSDGNRLLLQQDQQEAARSRDIGTRVGAQNRGAIVTTNDSIDVFVGDQISVNRVKLIDLFFFQDGFE